ncbi:CD209 antigen-like protein C [Triplophysa dalaica]|uniref:CD209 antigen-like protein C n=1 Tax=Triplophysa dalaica TaxID=1582913 RepID=UPI0024DFE41B|nr:CD209 antigen-like protein C [Triplophysa dalaica]
MAPVYGNSEFAKNKLSSHIMVSFRTETEIDVGKHHRVEEHLASSTDYIRSHSSEPCEDGWTAHDGNCYFFSSEMQTWFVSCLSCGALDAHLVIIETEKEQVFLRSQIKVYHWIGLNDLDTEGRWVWVSNQTLEETGLQFWLKRESGQNEPDNWKGEDSSGENCAITRILDHWSDVPCKRNFNFICEKKQISTFMHDD